MGIASEKLMRPSTNILAGLRKSVLVMAFRWKPTCTCHMSSLHFMVYQKDRKMHKNYTIGNQRSGAMQARLFPISQTQPLYQKLPPLYRDISPHHHQRRYTTTSKLASEENVSHLKVDQVSSDMGQLQGTENYNNELQSDKKDSSVSDHADSCEKVHEGKKFSVSELEEFYKDANFHPIFNFPPIIIARFISRLKILQTIATILGLPPITYGYLSGAASLGIVQLSYVFATFAAVMLYGMSFYFRRLIGVISMSEDGKVIRVGRLTFWGNRKNLFYYVDDVIPFSDMSENLNDVLVQFQAYNYPSGLYISLTHGKIQDMNKFERVFGALPVKKCDD